MRIRAVGVTCFLFCLASAAGLATAASTCGPDGVQASGSIYRICTPAPEDFNNRLVIWAHGFQDAGTPVGIPEDQLGFDDVSLPELFNDLGFGFATNSYSKTGLAVRQGMEDILDLVAIYAREQGVPDRVYLVGASEGGIITALLVEGHPGVFDAGVAACGPIGDFHYQLRYFGDARATFQYFFPELIPGDPFAPPDEIVSSWREYFEAMVRPALRDPENARALAEWVTVAKLPFDPDNWQETVEQSAYDVLRYSIVNLDDAARTLGGFPFGNYGRWYRGSSDDLQLNLLVPRVAADQPALDEIADHYTTSGDLEAPLMTLHTRADQQVPYLHETLYTLKNLRSGSFISKRLNFAINRYGHCNFTEGEAVFAFAMMLVYAGDAELLPGFADLLTTEKMAELEAAAAGLRTGQSRLRRLP
ncbi:MAG: prolyl oligopeptidase family serine peptidase [Thermoanaerobaculales bacterium]|nr:prolyl oligopeptidase family serine peptidase [Thermoanaerobaculales bacterium]